MIKIAKKSTNTAVTSLILAAQAGFVNSQSQGVTLEEVLVVAQKREESLQDAPISIRALGGEELEMLGVRSLDDLTGKIPNLSLSPFPADATALRVFIRGIGINDVQVSQDAGVGVYLDGVYIARSTGLATEINDLASLEVLRGPQGTLFGRNAIGGALNMRTVRPDPEELYFRQELSVGDRNLLRTKSVLNVPLTDSMAAKFIYLGSDQDGYVENDSFGSNFYDSDDNGIRFDFRWNLSDTTIIDYAYDSSESKVLSPSSQSIRPPLESDPLFGSTALAPLNPDTIFYTEEEPLGGLPSIAPPRNSVTETDGHALTISWSGTTATFKSITAYRELDGEAYNDFSRSAGVLENGEFFLLAETALDINIFGDNVFGISGEQSFDATGALLEQEQFSQEFQLLGSYNEQIEYIIGAYYFQEEASEQNPLGRLTSAFNASVPGIGRTDVLRLEDRQIENEAWAVFGKLDFTPEAFDQRLTLMLGLRYTDDTREASNRALQDTFLSNGMGGAAGSVAALGLADFGGAGLLVIDGDAKNSFDNFSFDFTAKYQFTDYVNGYAKVASGYKSGGFNIREIVTEQFEAGFDEETITTYEVGLKSELLDRRVRLNAAAFFSNYDDVQLNLSIPPGQTLGEVTLPYGTFDISASVTDTNVINAGTAEIKGLELDITAIPADGWLISASYAYLDTEFTDIDDPRPFADPNASFVFNSAPEHTANINVSYTFDPFDVGVLSASVNYGYTDDRYANSDTFFEDNALIDSFSLVDARVQLSEVSVGSAGNLRFAIWGTNLTDEEYLIDSVVTFPGSSRSVWFGEPRTYGFDVAFEYR